MTTTVSPTATYNVGTENLTGGDIQRVKIITGATGVDGGNVTSGNPFPVSAVISGTGNVNIDQYGGTATTLGQKTAAASIPVTLSSDVSYIDTDPIDRFLLVGGNSQGTGLATLFQTTKLGGDNISTVLDYFLTASVGLGLDETAGDFSRFRVDRDADNTTAGGAGSLRTSARLFVFDGTNWDRARGDTTNGIDVDVTRVSGTVTTSPTGASFSSATTSTLGVTTSSQTALASNGSRKYAIFQNDSDTTIYIKLGTTAVASTGIRLNPNGGWYEINTSNLYTGIVTAIHAGSGTKTLLITEG